MPEKSLEKTLTRMGTGRSREAREQEVRRRQVMVLQWRQGLTGEGLGTTDLLPLKEQNITGPGAR